jgi:hypothetical protein
MGPFDLAVEPRGAGLDVDMAGALVRHLPVEAGAELDPVVGLDDLDPERQPLQHLAADAVIPAGQATLPVISSAWRRIARRRLAILTSCCSVTESPSRLETRSVNHPHQFHKAAMMPAM